MKFRKKKALPLLFIISSWLFLFQTNIPSVKASLSWLDGWDFRQSHVIENATTAGTNYQVYFDVYQTSGSSSGNSVYLNEHNASTFPNDLRFTDNDGLTLLDYWVEESNSSWAGVWVEVADNLNTTDQTIYVYYGKRGVSSADNGYNTFMLFDHFPGSSLNTSIWSDDWTYGTGGTLTVGNSLLKIRSTSTIAGRGIKSLLTFTPPYAFKGKSKIPAAHVNYIGMFNSANINPTYTFHQYAVFRHDGGRDQTIEANGTADDMDYLDWDNSNFLSFEILRDSNADSDFYIDGTIVDNDHDCSPIDPTILRVVSYRATTHIEVDWVFIRKYVNPEPIHSDWGSEEGVHDVEATIDINPNTLNLRSQGRWIAAYIELPQGYNVSDIVVSSIRLNETFSVDPDASTYIGDYDSDGISDLMVKFNRTELTSYLYNIVEVRLDTVVLTVSGQLADGTLFEGSDIVRTRLAGDVNEDCVVDVIDFSMVGRSFGARIEEDAYEEKLDLTSDGVIDLRDLMLIGINYGATIPE